MRALNCLHTCTWTLLPCVVHVCTLRHGYIAKLAAAGIDVLIDMHNMPGGSSHGTYNGVFPHAPLFWDDDTLKAVGRGILREMMNWYVALPRDLQKAIGGFTLLNEPAHFMAGKKESMLLWYADAVRDYREIVASSNDRAGVPVPKLYVNMIETSGLDVHTMAGFMERTFTPAELDEWAILDLHMYLAWGYSGCSAGAGTCVWSCDADPRDIRSNILAQMRQRVNPGSSNPKHLLRELDINPIL